MSGHDNLPSGGTGEAEPLSIDDAMALDFYDPSEDNEETGNAEQSQDEPGEIEDDQEAEDIEAAADDDTEGEEPGETDEASEPDPEPADDVHVTVNGEKIALSELKAGYRRQADYSRKTQEVAEKRKGLEALTSRVTNSVNAIADFLVKQIPAAPDPQLAMTNPGQFVQQKAMHEAATAQITALLEQAGQVKDVAQALTVEQLRELRHQENAKLAEVFPATATGEGRKAFFDTAAAAAKELGYSDDEIKQVMDHRMFSLAHYAAIGMRAEKAREKAKAKVQNAPPVAPQKAQKQGVNASKARRNQEAMKRLARTGSIADALAIDFD
jgi:hypothetical protein